MGTLFIESDEELRTDFLVTMPSVLLGVARLVDLGTTLDAYNISPTPEDADTIAIASDWRMVGKDLRDAIVTQGDVLSE
jgi:hypothetical protein